MLFPSVYTHISLRITAMHAVHVPQLIFQLNIVSNEITRFNRIISSDVKRRGSVFFKIRLHQAQERCDNEVHISRAFNCRFFAYPKATSFGFSRWWLWRATVQLSKMSVRDNDFGWNVHGHLHTKSVCGLFFCLPYESALSAVHLLYHSAKVCLQHDDLQWLNNFQYLRWNERDPVYWP